MNRITLTLVAILVIALAAGVASQLVASDTPVVPALPHAACLDLAPLEALAVKGELPAEATACLDARLAVSAGKTQSRISRVLMVDATARRDNATWERRLLHHLTAIEATDPDLAYNYAFHRSKAETVDGWKDAIRWSDAALAHRSAWSGELLESRERSLSKLREEALSRCRSAAPDPADCGS